MKKSNPISNSLPNPLPVHGVLGRNHHSNLTAASATSLACGPGTPALLMINSVTVRLRARVGARTELHPN